MKLAVLLYGQPRFWDLSYESILQETTFEGCTTDYYFHFWDKIGYGHSDPESVVTDQDKQKLIDIYQPKKYEFTDYQPLTEKCNELFEFVNGLKGGLNYFYKENGKMIPLNLGKSIFEICEPEHLEYYLGQFTSLERAANLVEGDYDYIFRIRTDLMFVTPDMYEDERFYRSDKKLFYHRLEKQEKGVFCKFGDLQIWEGARDVSKNHTDHQPIKRTTYEQFSILNDTLYAKKRGKGDCEIYNPKVQYLHMKDWYILGSGKEMLHSMKNYFDTIYDMVEKSRYLLKTYGIDINWAAGEIVCGEVLGREGINAGELGHEFLKKMVIPQRIMKIANKNTKQCILDRPKVRVLADSDIPLKEQYKKIIQS